MPIVINEIEVSVEVAHPAPGTAPQDVVGNVSKEEIVRECVEKVMEILNQKNER
jgi:hypothetical protein